PTHIGFIYFKDDKYHTFEVLPESTYYFQTEHSEMFIHYLVQQMKDKHESIFSGDFIKHYPSFLTVRRSSSRCNTILSYTAWLFCYIKRAQLFLLKILN